MFYREFQFKMVMQKDPEPTPSHRHTESTVTYETISSQKDLKSG